MKAILRGWNDEHYVVKEIECADNNTFSCEGRAINEVDILTLVNPDESKNAYVKCAACGEFVLNNKKAIAQHKSAHNTFEGCYNCKHLKANRMNNTEITTKFQLNENNTFARKVNDTVTLYCGHNYYNAKNITDPERMRFCKYKGCATAEMTALENFFTKFPNAFDDMITIDAIKIIKFIYNQGGGYTRLKLKCRGNIYAIANNKGIIHSFCFENKGGQYYVYYSKKYNKFFYNQYGKYIEQSQPYAMSDDRWNYIKETIAKLYN